MSKKNLLKIIVSVLIATLTKLKLRLARLRAQPSYGATPYSTLSPLNAKVFIGGPMVICITIMVILAALGLNSCNVVRTITNKSEFYQRGDTSVMIQTKTTESYDATKKL